MKSALASIGLILLCLKPLQADEASLRLGELFNDHMVLQSQQPLRIWGQETPGVQVTVKLAEANASATANKDGHWVVTLPAQPSGGPYTLQAEGSQSLTLKDVYLGQVWVCAGQSNMAMKVKDAAEAETITEDSKKRPLLRLTNVPTRTSDTPIKSWGKALTWQPADQGSGGFSAVGIGFGIDLQKELDEPVGIIQLAVGGSKIESWIPRESLAQNPQSAPLLELYETNIQRYEEARAVGKDKVRKPNQVKYASFLHNGMMVPLKDLSAKGIIWYQGESNSSDGDNYIPLFQQWLKNWRAMTHSPEMPVLTVQLPCYKPRQTEPVNNHSWGTFRLAQTQLAELDSNTGIVVTLDTGDAKDIHPKQKRVIGQRLAALALETVYDKNVPGQPPLADSLTKLDGDRYRIDFVNTYGDMTTFDHEAPRGLAVQGKDNTWHWAENLELKGASLVFKSPVTPLKAVRYNWAPNPVGNLANNAGHPAGPFELLEP